MLQDSHPSNQFLNSSISEDEVKRAIGRLKVRKATGMDDLPNEILKIPCLFEMLHNPFSVCFEYGLVPSDWHRSIIKPIPKSSNNDPRVPLN